MSAPDARLIDADEQARHKAARARGEALADIVLCEAPGCPRAALQGSLCTVHRPAFTSSVGGRLNNEEIATIRAEVEARAAPLFVLAMEWIARGQLARMGVALEAGG